MKPYLSGVVTKKPYSSCWAEETETHCTGTTVFMASPVHCTFTDEIVTLDVKSCSEGIYL